jgi:hypothetical protein
MVPDLELYAYGITVTLSVTTTPHNKLLVRTLSKPCFMF